MKRTTLLIFLMAILVITAFLLPETNASAASLKKVSGKTDLSRIDEQGNVVLSISRKKLESAGYKYGDVIKVSFAGKKIKMPIVSKSADVDEGKPALLMRDNDKYVRLSLSGGSFADKYGIAVKTTDEDGGFEWNYADGITGPVKVSIRIKKTGEYLNEYNKRKDKGIDYLALVNKQNPLPDDWEKYLETTFVTNSVGDYVEVELKAYAAVKKLMKDVEKNDGIHIELDSARRSIAAQQDIWDRFMVKYGEEYTVKTVAPVGYSEHHTGLAIDLYFIMDGVTYYYNEDMVQHPEVWEKIHNKLAKYGFILRYPKGKEDITGYGYEEWHLRYIDDPAIAEYIMEKGITFEEYIEERNQKIADAFPSWNPDSRSLKELVDFVADTTNINSPNYISPEERIAVFDMDGTILCEKAPVYIDYCMTMYRVLDDPTYEATEEERDAMQQIRDHAYTDGTTFKPEGMTKDDLVASAFAGMTPEEFREYVVNFADNTDVVGFSGMKYGESFYKPMIEVIDYLRDNGFDVWMVSACEREVVRALVERFGIPYDRVIATDVPYVASGSEGKAADEYNMAQDEKIILGAPLDEVECGKSGKPAAIAREIGRVPVLAFGNSSGDYSMLNYAEGNQKHKGMGFFIVCDDTVREYGSDTKAAEFYKIVEDENWTAISMADDWKTIYGEGVEKTELPLAEIKDKIGQLFKECLFAA